jgi:DNA-binding transcriptional LysR family regulator
MIQAACGGLGLCQMPLSAVRNAIQTGELVTVLDDYAPVPVAVTALWPQVAHLRPKLRHLVDVLVDLGSKGALD